MLNRSGASALQVKFRALGGFSALEFGPSVPSPSSSSGLAAAAAAPPDHAAGTSETTESALGAGERSPSSPAAPRAEPSPVDLPPAWFHEHFNTLWRLVARLGVPGHSVDDVVQEVFITASRRRADIAPGQERRFLLGVAVRLSSNYRQRAHVRREISHGDGLEQNASLEPDAEQLLIEKRLRELLEHVLSSLSDAHRDVFVLYELEGFSVPELSELLNLPIGTVASRLGRARAKFSEAAARLQRTSRLPERS